MMIPEVARRRRHSLQISFDVARIPDCLAGRTHLKARAFLGAVVMLRYPLTARRDRNPTGGSYWSATPVLFPNFYNAVLTSGYRKDNISVMHNDRFRGSLVDFQRQRSSQLTGGDFGWPGCLDGKGQAIRA